MRVGVCLPTLLMVARPAHSGLMVSSPTTTGSAVTSTTATAAGHYHGHLVVHLVHCKFPSGGCMAVDVVATNVDIRQVAWLVVELLSPPIAQSFVAFAWCRLPVCCCAQRLFGQRFDFLPAPRQHLRRILRILHLLQLCWHFLRTQNFRPLPVG